MPRPNHALGPTVEPGKHEDGGGEASAPGVAEIALQVLDEIDADASRLGDAVTGLLARDDGGSVEGPIQVEPRVGVDDTSGDGET